MRHSRRGPIFEITNSRRTIYSPFSEIPGEGNELVGALALAVARHATGVPVAHPRIASWPRGVPGSWRRADGRRLGRKSDRGDAASGFSESRVTVRGSVRRFLLTAA